MCFLRVADLKRQFAAAPYGVRIALGEQAELRCLPPQGVPAPTVSWQRNGQPLSAGPGGPGGASGASGDQALAAAAAPSVFVSGEGHLLVSRARLADQANYTCVAENIAGRRMSEPAQITVYGECTLLLQAVLEAVLEEEQPRAVSWPPAAARGAGEFI